MFIDFDFVARCIKECASFLGKEKKICFHMNGEPFLYKKLSDLVKLAKDEGFDYIFVTTNGTVGTEEYLAKIFERMATAIPLALDGGLR